eukprot:scaffold48491_cov20-Prasinocladus_malaysianus.AAC.1
MATHLLPWAGLFHDIAMWPCEAKVDLRFTFLNKELPRMMMPAEAYTVLIYNPSCAVERMRLCQAKSMLTRHSFIRE